MVLVSILFFMYFLMLALFFIVKHSVYYCGLLVVKALLSRFMCYFLFGFRWYSLLFCLVYIGGVYILFVFVSVYCPNNRYIVRFNYDFLYLFGCGLMLFVVGAILVYGLLNREFRTYLCTKREGIFYILLCLTLLFGFLVLRMIMSVKLNYYR